MNEANKTTLTPEQQKELATWLENNGYERVKQPASGGFLHLKDTTKTSEAPADGHFLKMA